MSDNCLFSACDHMVASLDDDQFRSVTVSLHVFLADIGECLGIFPYSQSVLDFVGDGHLLHLTLASPMPSEAFHEFRRVGRVESGTEELSVPACVLNYGSGCYEHQTGRLYRYYTSIYYNYI